MPLTLYNTLTRRLAAVKPLDDDHLRMYTCGPTVYARAHIGNFRTFVFEDILRRWCDRTFRKVTHVMNLTDVDDKIIRNAVAHHASLTEETSQWIEGFFEDLDALGIRRAHHYPRATEYVDEMVSLITTLRERGHTYDRDGSIYYRIDTFPSYGKLSGMKQEGLIDGASGRVDADEYSKDDARDFALWKAVGPDEIGWDTTLGRGRPGWHIECSAMSSALLGPQFDLHCGGIDNIFPHHENEIAQSEGATGQQFVSVWCHSAHLQIEGEKMAKSLGNFFTVHDLITEAHVQPSAIRYLLAATAHYRKTLSYSQEALVNAREAVERWSTFATRCRSMEATGTQRDVTERCRSSWDAFASAMDDDLNLPEAMGVVFREVRELNKYADAAPFAPEEKEALLQWLADIDDILGVLPLVEREQTADLSPDEQQLLDAREAARAARKWSDSDALRAQLEAAGILVEDTPQGQRWRRA